MAPCRPYRTAFRAYNKQANSQGSDIFRRQRVGLNFHHLHRISSSAIAERPRDARVTSIRKIASGIFEAPFWAA